MDLLHSVTNQLYETHELRTQMNTMYIINPITDYRTGSPSQLIINLHLLLLVLNQLVEWLVTILVVH